MSKRKTTTRRNEKIPPPPGPEVGYDAIIAYFDRYPTDELVRAGHLTDPKEEDLQEFEAAGAYELLRSRGIRLKLSAKDCARLSALAASQQLAPDELVRKWVQYLLGKAKRKPKQRVLP